jgi:hypothetical protein
MASLTAKDDGTPTKGSEEGRKMARLILVATAAALALAVCGGVAQAAISSFTVNPKATLSADRTQATVTGTITCTSGDSFGANASITEVVGRIQRSAFGYTPSPSTCSGAAQPWAVTTSIPIGSTLVLVPGPASLTGGLSDVAPDGSFTFVNLSGSILLVP